jgi:hypothetical protein
MQHRFSRLFLPAIVLVIALMSGACGSREKAEDIQPVGSIEAQTALDASPAAKPAPTPTNLPTELVEPISPISPISPIKGPAMSSKEEEVLAAAIADLAEQTGLAESDIRLVSMAAVEWNDASLGCPQEGFMYAQVITPGYLMFLEAGGQQYEYHSDQRANVVLCQQK